MSAFDDEFGLFGDELQTAEEDENRSTLGARVIATGNEIVIDEIEPEDEDRRPRGRSNGTLAPSGERGRGNFRRRESGERRPSGDPAELRVRAIELLSFLAKGLVTKPDVIFVEAHEDQRQGLVLELEVAAEDLGKVIGRGGRVAQALRTVVRAGVEGRVAIEIIDVDADDNGDHEVAMTVNDATESALHDETDDADSLEILADDVIAEPGTLTLRAPSSDVNDVAAQPKKKAAPRRRTRVAAADEAQIPDAVATVDGEASDSDPAAAEAVDADGASEAATAPKPRRVTRPRKTTKKS
jgi:predicted RNA-binding protein YlqC (UPF0109 family)